MTPDWLLALLGLAEVPADSSRLTLDGVPYVMKGGTLRSLAPATSAAQEQTSAVFGYKWHQPGSYESEVFRRGVREWLVQRYGDPATVDWWPQLDDLLFLDLGCGGGLSGTEFLGSRLLQVRYLGVDVSDAVDPAATRLAAAGADFGLLQCDLSRVPIPRASADIVFSEGVLHHSDSTKEALLRAAELVKPGGLLMFYVYRRKGPIREFTDDYIRAQLVDLPPSEAWESLRPLTKLGQVLAENDFEIDVEEEISLLDIPAGRTSLHRLLYWHVVKAFHRPGLSLEEMNHVNFDWFAPKNCHRQSPEEVRDWCASAELEILSERIEEAGITMVTRRSLDG